MVASCLVFLGLATVGIQADAAGNVPLNGVVSETDGRPAGNVHVLATAGSWVGDAPKVTARATTDAEGRFAMVLPVHPEGSDRPTVWAFRPGSVVASSPIDREARLAQGVRLTLGKPGSVSFTVNGPDGRAVPGAQVIPRKLSGDGPALAELLGTWTASTTDAQGKTLIAAFRPEDLVGVMVQAPGFGSQLRDFRGVDGLADHGPRSVSLRAVGQVRGRVVAKDPKAVAGLGVRVVSTWNGVEVGLADGMTDASGRFDFPEVASGRVTIRVQPREGSPELPARVVRQELEPGKAVEAEIPLRRGVRVFGLVVEKTAGLPVDGVVVSVIPTGPLDPRAVRTDLQGRYETFVPSGSATHRVLNVPDPYLGPPGFNGPRPVDIPVAINGIELPTIELVKGGRVQGLVVDDDGQAVNGARVEASWTIFEGRNRTPRSVSTTSRPDGSFDIGPVDPEAELALNASSGAAKTLGSTLSKVSDAAPARLTLAEPDASSPIGRVVDLEGRGIAGAIVRVVPTVRAPNSTHDLELRTDAEGRFRGPRQLHRDREYRVLATAPRYLDGRSLPFKPTGGETLAIPDLVLIPIPWNYSVEGRILDRRGQPILGATVWSSAHRDGVKSDRDGKFRLDGVPAGKSFLFGSLDGYRFAGRIIDPSVPGSDLILAGVDESVAASMATRKLAPDGPGLASKVLAPYVDRVLDQGDHSTKIRTLELLARVDPRRVLALVDAQGVDDAWFADHLRAVSSRALLASGVGIDEVRPAIEAIRDDGSRAMAELVAADALPRAAKLEWIDRAIRDARGAREPSEKVEALGQVADRLIDIGDLGRARVLLDEACPLAEALPCATSGGRVRCGLVSRLARLDPARALALTEDLIDPADADHCRLEVAIAVASRDPVEATRIVSTLRDPKSLASKIPSLCHAMARLDPDLARGMIDRVKGVDPGMAPYALGMMALAVSEINKPLARRWLLEAYERLGLVASLGLPASASTQDPAAVAAALLPVAERVDGSLVPELFWRSVSFHASRAGSNVRAEAALAILLARYDREVANILAEPLVTRFRSRTLAEADLGPVVEAAESLDPRLALNLVNGLPEPPDLAFHHPKNAARLALAAALYRDGPEGWDDATTRLLKLWSRDGRTSGE